MKHIASLREGDLVRYALVDEETGELVQFALLQVPEHFDFEQSALLGTNLADVLGLNGRGPRSKPVEAIPVAESVDSAPAPAPHRGRPSNTPGVYITKEMVLDVVNQHPEGIGLAEIAVGIAQGRGVRYTSAMLKQVSNRCTAMEQATRQRGVPLPYRSATEPRVNGDGSVSKMHRKVLYPRDA